MYGIYLHIIADTLGSVGVIVSTIFIYYFGWFGFDPIASIFIAILIFISAIPLVTSSAKTLLLSLNSSQEYQLREILDQISVTPGVAGYSVPKFWADGQKIRGVIHVQYSEGNPDSTVIRNKVEEKLKEHGIENIVIQVEEEGSPCWCKKSVGM
jgi:zinc transporter 5/7